MINFYGMKKNPSDHGIMRRTLIDAHSDRLLRVSTNHILLQPHPRLRRQIAYYTILFPDHGAGRSFNLIPDASGCLTIRINASSLKSCYWGPVSQIRRMCGNAGNNDFQILVELRPGGGYFLLGTPMNLLHNAVFPLDVIDKCLDRDIQRAFEKSGCSIPVFIDLLDCIFLSQMEKRKECLPVRYLTERIIASSGNVRINSLASIIGYTERHISRLCAEYVGLSPKQIARIIRINAACHVMRQTSVRSLTELAHLLGFFDQAHFIHEFKAVCRVSPSVYTKNMSEFYNDEPKFFPVTKGKQSVSHII